MQSNSPAQHNKVHRTSLRRLNSSSPGKAGSRDPKAARKTQPLHQQTRAQEAPTHHTKSSHPLPFPAPTPGPQPPPTPQKETGNTRRFSACDRCSFYLTPKLSLANRETGNTELECSARQFVCAARVRRSRGSGILESLQTQATKRRAQTRRQSLPAGSSTTTNLEECSSRGKGARRRLLARGGA